MRMLGIAVAVCTVLSGSFVQAEETPDPTRDILVTFDNHDAQTSSAGLSVPYQHRRRYSIARKVRRDATAVAEEYSLKKIVHWPIRSLSVYCFIYRVPEGVDRQVIIATLNADIRVESAQPLQSFETSLKQTDAYDDTYANLQYGLDILDIAAVHQTTRGAGIRIAIIDSQIDRHHEDLQGRIDVVGVFSNKGKSADKNHGTAIASVIGARSNNALGMVGVAPEATLELYVSCWSGGALKAAVCDSFSLSKALDAMLKDPPNVLNLSLNGPYDPLLERLIQRALVAGVVVVAAAPASFESQKSFPSNMQHVIGVRTIATDESGDDVLPNTLFAPGNRILVAVPANRYDFRSGSSLAAAHVSGVVALLLSNTPDRSAESINDILQRSQISGAGSVVSINACDALNLADSAQHCRK